MTVLMSVDKGKYNFSCIDSGYGKSMGLYEVAIFEKNNASFLGLKSTVKGWLEWGEVKVLYDIFKSCPHTNWSKYGFS